MLAPEHMYLIPLLLLFQLSAWFQNDRIWESDVKFCWDLPGFIWEFRTKMKYSSFYCFILWSSRLKCVTTHEFLFILGENWAIKDSRIWKTLCIYYQTFAHSCMYSSLTSLSLITHLALHVFWEGVSISDWKSESLVKFDHPLKNLLFGGQEYLNPSPYAATKILAENIQLFVEFCSESVPNRWQ